MITPQWIQNDDVRSFVPLEILKHLNKARSRKLTWALCCAFLPRAADEGLTMPLASIWNLSYIVLDIELLLAAAAHRVIFTGYCSRWKENIFHTRLETAHSPLLPYFLVCITLYGALKKLLKEGSM